MNKIVADYFGLRPNHHDERVFIMADENIILEALQAVVEENFESDENYERMNEAYWMMRQ